ncbi:hypothetical protein RF11_06799 [Thelohanellus kitauei]|uniref:Uncharacterized protein n=1 Tax=Thelohanellus kitauei TaxID=669202 RepID=A0A0C2ISD2_THEKT|nr:hypothetical protein RF11_06799 [Thelohanellus kitauei]
MFGDQEDEESTCDAKRVPIIHVTPHQKDSNHPNIRHCHDYSKIYHAKIDNRFSDPEQYQNHETLSKLLDLPLEYMPNISHIWDEVSMAKLNNKLLPQKFIDHYETIEKFAVSYFKYRLLSEY